MDPSLDAEIKIQSMMFKGKGRMSADKAKVLESAGKVMSTVFWDNRGLLLIDTVAHYCEVFKKLQKAIQNKGGVSCQKQCSLFTTALVHMLLK